MKLFRYLSLLPLLSGLISATPEEEAAKKLRAGDAVGVLTVLSGTQGPESDFWKGRALVELHRMKEAAVFLSKVPENHELYPYAAKALLYCAWQSPEVQFSSVVPTLAASQNPEIAKIAAAALAEYWLQQPESQDNTALELLRGMAEKSPEFLPVLQLLEVENLRQKGNYEEAIRLCRAIEENRDFTPEIRRRVRLALAEVYYAQEAAGFPGKQNQKGEGFLSGITSSEEEVDEQETPAAEGTGEETLLHFISTNPESPLLPEAFRRLASHKAFTTGKYARERLKEWIEDEEKPQRAALSLLILQYLINQDNPESIAPDNTCANTALTLFPREKTTQLILLEHVRYLLEYGNLQEASKYLAHVTQDSPYRTFYAATILAESDALQAGQMFRDCARNAPENLRPAAFANSLICALRSGNHQLEKELLEYAYYGDDAKAEVYAALFLYHMGRDTATARSALQKLQTIPYHESDFMVDFLLDKAWFNLDDSPLMVEQELTHANTKLFLPKQLLRYYMMREAAMRKASPVDRKSETEDRICEMMTQAIETTPNRHLNHKLRFHLAHLFSKRSQHADAYHQLIELNRLAGDSPMAAQSLFHAAHEKELIGTADSLAKAAEIYSLCAEKYPELKIPASIQQASVLIRIGKGDEAESSLKHILNKEESLTPEHRTLILMTLSNKYALEGTTEGLKKALQVGEQNISDSSLSKKWRSLALLHHAAICSRSGEFLTAYRDYSAVLELKPAERDGATDREWAIFHQAAIGAVASLLELEQYKDAADLADRISDHKTASGRTRKLKRYAEWATYIRRTNFLRNE